MLWQVFTFILLICFAMIALTLINATARKHPIMLLLCAILLSVAALYSFDVTYYECNNQIGWMNVTADNVTKLTNNVVCKETSFDYSPLGFIFSGMAVIFFILFLVEMFQVLKKGYTYDR